MDLKRFEEIVDAYGAEPRRWPEGERRAAEAFATGREEARAILFAARQMDVALESAVQPIPSAALRERILAAAPKRRMRRSLLSFGDLKGDRRAWLSGAGLAAACACGMVFGSSLVHEKLSDTRADAVLAVEAAAADEVEELV